MIVSASTMSQHRKHRGYASQEIVAQYLRDNGWEFATSTGAGRQGSDVINVPFDIEIKARRGLVISETMRQLKERAKQGLGIGILRLDGQGEKQVDDWVGIIRLADLVYLLKASGYEGEGS
jgi:hypothetical protein